MRQTASRLHVVYAEGHPASHGRDAGVPRPHPCHVSRQNDRPGQYIEGIWIPKARMKHDRKRQSACGGVACLGGGANDDRVDQGDLGQQLVLGEVVGAVDGAHLLQHLHAALTQLLGHQDGRLGLVHDNGDNCGGGKAAAAEVEARPRQTLLEPALQEAEGLGNLKAGRSACQRRGKACCQWRSPAMPVGRAAVARRFARRCATATPATCRSQHTAEETP